MDKAPVTVGRLEDFPVGQFRITQVRGVEIGVIRMHNGELRAIRNHCPHRGAPICKGSVTGTWPPCEPGQMRYEMQGQVLVCPWHGYEYDLATGRELFQRRATQLRMYPVAVEDGNVVVTV